MSLKQLVQCNLCDNSFEAQNLNVIGIEFTGKPDMPPFVPKPNIECSTHICIRCARCIHEWGDDLLK
jgi:hypothetical protein